MKASLGRSGGLQDYRQILLPWIHVAQDAAPTVSDPAEFYKQVLSRTGLSSSTDTGKSLHSNAVNPEST